MLRFAAAEASLAAAEALWPAFSAAFSALDKEWLDEASWRSALRDDAENGEEENWEVEGSMGRVEEVWARALAREKG